MNRPVLRAIRDDNNDQLLSNDDNRIKTLPATGSRRRQVSPPTARPHPMICYASEMLSGAHIVSDRVFFVARF